MALQAQRATTLEEQKKYGVKPTLSFDVAEGEEATDYKKAGYNIVGENKNQTQKQQPQIDEYGRVLSGGKYVDTATSKKLPANRPVLTTAENQNFAQFNLPQVESLESVRERELRKAQALVDATNEVYQAELAKIQKENQGRLQETQSIAVGAGLAGSPFQGALTDKTKEQNRLIDGQRQAERSKEIQQILSYADEKAQKLYQSQIENYRADREFLTNERDKELENTKIRQEAARTRGVESIKTLAQGGYSIEEIPVEEYKKLLQDSGITDLEARALFSLNNPEAKADYSIEGSTLIGVFIDPKTGKPKVTTQNIPELDGVKEPKIQEFNGIPYVIGTDAEGNLKGTVLPGYKNTTAPETQEVDGTLLSWNPETNSWESSFTSVDSAEQKPPKIEKIGDEFKQWNEEKGVWEQIKTDEIAAPEKIALADDIISLIEELKTHPGKNLATGFSSFSTKAKGTDPYDFGIKFNNLIAKLSLDNVGLLKGPMSDKDLQFIKDASAGGLDLGLKTEAFDKQLDELLTKFVGAKEKINIQDTYSNSGDEIDSFLENIDNSGETGFNQVGSDTNKATKDLSKLKEGSTNLSFLGKGVITGFGSKYWAPGLDFAMDGGKGAPVKFSVPLKVVKSVSGYKNPKNKPLSYSDGKKQNGGFGNQVTVQLPNGEELDISHLDLVANLKPGMVIPPGGVFATQGNTGLTYGNTGTHLDLTIRKNGKVLSAKQVAAILGDARLI